MSALNPAFGLAELEVAIERSRHVNYVDMASFSIIVLDWLLTFDLEVSLIWKAKWTIGTLLYLISRYLTFVDAALITYHQLGFGLSSSACQKVYEVLASEFLFGAVIVELVFTLRTISVWSKSKRFTWSLSLLFAAACIGNTITFGFYLKNLEHYASPAPGLVGCIVVSGTSHISRYLSANYMLLMMFDGYLLVVMITRCIADFRSGGLDSPFMRVVYTDGIIYYVYIFGLSLLNVLILIKLPDDYQTLLLLLQRTIHSVLACRVVLHIRHQIAMDASWQKDSEVCSPGADTFNFEQYLSGNAPLVEGSERSSTHRYY